MNTQSMSWTNRAFNETNISWTDSGMWTHTLHKHTVDYKHTLHEPTVDNEHTSDHGHNDYTK